MSGDPAFITQADWKAVSELLRPIWMILGSNLGLAFSLLLAHGAIPSMATTRHLPQATAARARPPLYAAAAVFLVLSLFSVTVLITRLDVVSTIFYRGAI